MFCPYCSAYLRESQLIKTNVKSYKGTPLDYDARCPYCNVHIGRMFWGKLEPAPGLGGYFSLFGEGERADAPGSSQDDAAVIALGSDPPAKPRFKKPEAVIERHAEQEPFAEIGPDLPEGWERTPEPPYPPPSYYFCPHCGLPLPEDKNDIPYRQDTD